jgi:hypothetical protein
VFEQEREKLQKAIETRVVAIHDIDQKLKALRDPKKRRDILRSFRQYYAAARHALDLPAADTIKMSFSGSPKAFRERRSAVSTGLLCCTLAGMPRERFSVFDSGSNRFTKPAGPG